MGQQGIPRTAFLLEPSREELLELFPCSTGILEESVLLCLLKKHNTRGVSVRYGLGAQRQRSVCGLGFSHMRIRLDFSAFLVLLLVKITGTALEGLPALAGYPLPYTFLRLPSSLYTKPHYSGPSPFCRYALFPVSDAGFGICALEKRYIYRFRIYLFPSKSWVSSITVSHCIWYTRKLTRSDKLEKTTMNNNVTEVATSLSQFNELSSNCWKLSLLK